ncbi:MAG: type IV pilus modification PilV family protein [Planctomycetaceae bacterium]
MILKFLSPMIKDVRPLDGHAMRTPAHAWRRARRGLSIMEVLFAIGVLMVGLLGIAAVLPVGTKNAAGALRSDATTGAVENQIHNARTRLGTSLTRVQLPMHSSTVNTAGIGPASGLSTGVSPDSIERYAGKPFGSTDITNLITYATARGTSSGYLGLNVDSTGTVLSDPFEPIAASRLIPRPSFCIDPAFLTAAPNIRTDAGGVGTRPINGYDRTRFPCYDLNYNPLNSPGAQLTVAAGMAMTPRMYRVGLTSEFDAATPSNVTSQMLLSERDGLPLMRPKDKTRAPGLFIRRTSGTVGPLDVQRSGNYSSMITIVPTGGIGRNYEVSVVVFESRQLTTNVLNLDTDDINFVSRLTPFTAGTWPNDGAAAEDRTYGDEVVGLVEASPGMIIGGVGQLTYIHSETCNPTIKPGHWVMLGRWIEPEGINRFSWYRVSDVITPPAHDAVAGVYRTSIEVRGPDWLFHPAQVPISGSGAPLAFQWNTSPTAPGDPPYAFTVNDYNRLTTILVKMPTVVSVQTITMTL